MNAILDEQYLDFDERQEIREVLQFYSKNSLKLKEKLNQLSLDLNNDLKELGEFETKFNEEQNANVY